MIYLVIGTIICLSGIGLMNSEDSLLKMIGMVLLIIGASIIFKGRREIDKFMGRKDK